MAGDQLHANSQLMYYSTSQLETLRMLGLIGEIKIGDVEHSMDSWRRALYLDALKQELGQDVYLELGTQALDHDVEIDFAIYDYCIRENRHDLIKKYFCYTVAPRNKTVTIADLQAGEGEWLRTFQDFIPHTHNSACIKTIANELEETRYSKIQADYKYLGSFEELQLPTNSISLLLFNPPYGTSNNERNVRRYLRMTLERNYLAKLSYIIMVINEKDAKDVADLFNKHFTLLTMYRTHPKEYDKFGQLIIIGSKRHKPLEDDNRYHAYDIENGVKTYLDELKNAKDFSLKLYNQGKYTLLPEVDIELIMNNFEYVINDKAVLSNKQSRLWKEIFDLTEVKDMSTEKLVLPKPPKQGEIANLLASGQINGTMEIEKDGKIYKHIVVGGVKTLEEQESIEKEGFTEVKTLKYSKPYLNILVTENGRYKVKELEADMF